MIFLHENTNDSFIILFYISFKLKIYSRPIVLTGKLLTTVKPSTPLPNTNLNYLKWRKATLCLRLNSHVLWSSITLHSYLTLWEAAAWSYLHIIIIITLMLLCNGQTKLALTWHQLPAEWSVAMLAIMFAILWQLRFIGQHFYIWHQYISLGCPACILSIHK